MLAFVPNKSFNRQEMVNVCFFLVLFGGVISSGVRMHHVKKLKLLSVSLLNWPIKAQTVRGNRPKFEISS